MTTKTRWLQRVVLLGLAGAGALLARGCGGVTDTRVAARDQAAQATCMRYQTCMDIGTGLTYSDYSSCITAWEGKWEDAWPAGTCQGRIDNTQLGVCLDAIGATACTGFDFVLTLAKCGSGTVCDLGVPIDAAAD
jgi:hypothetical protein